MVSAAGTGRSRIFLKVNVFFVFMAKSRPSTPSLQKTLQIIDAEDNERWPART